MCKFWFIKKAHNRTILQTFFNFRWIEEKWAPYFVGHCCEKNSVHLKWDRCVNLKEWLIYDRCWLLTSKLDAREQPLLGFLDLLPIILAMKRCRDLLFFYPRFFGYFEINGKIAQKMIHAIKTRAFAKKPDFTFNIFPHYDYCFKLVSHVHLRTKKLVKITSGRAKILHKFICI